MRRTLLGLLGVSLGCGVETGRSGPVVRCAPQADNVLRVDCSVHPPSHGLRVAVSRPDGEAAVFVADEGSASVTVWNLTERTDYAWVAEVDGWQSTGAFTTGALPGRAAVRLEDVEGEPTWDHLALPVSCGVPAHVGLMSASGDLVWYQEITADSELGSLLFTEGFRFTEEHTMLVVVGRQAIREFDLTGEVVFEEGRPSGALPGRLLRRAVDRGTGTVIRA